MEVIWQCWHKHYTFMAHTSIIFSFFVPAHLTDALTHSEHVHVALGIWGCGAPVRKDPRVCQHPD